MFMNFLKWFSITRYAEFLIEFFFYKINCCVYVRSKFQHNYYVYYINLLYVWYWSYNLSIVNYNSILCSKKKYNNNLRKCLYHIIVILYLICYFLLLHWFMLYCDIEILNKTHLLTLKKIHSSFLLGTCQIPYSG